jgi:hypothetical protein
LAFRQREKELTGYELDIIEQYLQINSEKVENSTDTGLLSL